jgi:hypothetical protein
MMLGDKGISQGETPAEADTSASPRSSLPLEGDGWVNWSGFGNSRNDTATALMPSLARLSVTT